MIQCGVTHKWIIHSHWLSCRLRKNDYMSWFSPASRQSTGQMRTMLSSRPPDSHDNGHCSWCCILIGLFGQRQHSTNRKSSQFLNKPLLGTEGRKDASIPGLSSPYPVSFSLVPSPPLSCPWGQSRVHLSVAYLLTSEGPWDLGKFLCALPLIFHIPNWGRLCTYIKETDGSYHRVLGRMEAQTCPLFLLIKSVLPSVDILLLSL